VGSAFRWTKGPTGFEATRRLARMCRDPRPAMWVAGALLFTVLATANAAGYRYGVSDQAFYIPAILRAIDPQLYPRDAVLIESQARLLLLDEAIGSVVRSTGISLPAVFALGYFASIALIWVALTAIGVSLYRSTWTTAALVLALTMRHRIPKTSANSFEAYFHPRVLAFAFGLCAVAALLRRRRLAAIALAGVSILVHPTTGLIFIGLIATALLVIDRRLRPWISATAVVGVVGVTWALMFGPLRDGSILMDETWRRVLAPRDFIFPADWPAWAWAANLALYATWLWSYIHRRRHARATPEDAGLLIGGGVLVLAFLVTLPLVHLGVAFFVQLQISRVFWVVDVLATVYVLSAIEVLRARAVRALALILLGVASMRGVYILWVEHPERPLFEFTIRDSPWMMAMRWLADRPCDVHVLADPGHAWKYGTSVRVAAARDVLLEAVKDSAIAMYSRPIAMRVLARSADIGDFDALTEERAQELAAKYELDYLVATRELKLPIEYRNTRFIVYRVPGGRQVRSVQGGQGAGCYSSDKSH
jgi:hypothetical protein